MQYKKDIDHKGLAGQQPMGNVNLPRGGESSSLVQNSNSMEVFTATLAKKCERLATAIYLVTNFLSDTEPLKSRLRTLSIELVREAAFTRSNGHMTEGHNLDALRGTILETLSLLELSFIAGLLSEMNFSILKREYAVLRDSIEIKKASRESRTDNVLGETFFGSSFHAEDQTHKDIIHKGHYDNAMSFRMSDKDTDTKKSDVKNSYQAELPRPDFKNFISPEARHTPPVQPRHITATQIGGSVSNVRTTSNVDKEARQSRIIKLVKDSHEVMVKDITIHFPGLSEKTLQRELVALVVKGVLKKTGERRWSRYSLV